MKKESTYRWANVYGWLEESSRGWTPERFQSEFWELARTMDFDSLQSIYESEMQDDGYFDEVGGTTD